MPLNVPVPADRLDLFRAGLPRAPEVVLLSYLQDQLMWEPIPRAQVMAEVEAELVRRELLLSR